MIKYFFTNSFGILASRILGFIRDLLFASFVGANIYSDIFFIAFKIPNLLRRIFGEGAFGVSFLPIYTNCKNRATFASAIFVKFLFFILIMCILVSFFAPLITKVIAYGFSDESIKLSAPLVAICFFYLPLIFIVTFLSALLNYKNHFSTSSFSSALLNLSLIICLLIFAKNESYDIVYALSWAVLIGGVLQVLLHIKSSFKMNVLKNFTLNKKILSYKLNNFYSLFFASILGSSAVALSSFIDMWLASFLQSGTISYLYYANRVFQLPLALFAIALSVAIFPTILKTMKNIGELKALKILQKSSLFLALTLGVATFVGIVFSDFIIWLLFERGEFSTKDTINTSSILIAYLIGLIPFGLSKVFLLWLYAKKQQKRVATISIYALVVNIILSLALLNSLGAFGLALASSISGFVLLGLCIREIGVKKILS
jgi:putative peptidoglycan lipid II flippase